MIFTNLIIIILLAGRRLRKGQVSKASARITAAARDGIAGPHRFREPKHDSERGTFIQTTG
jgi:hypothetical protein